MSYEYDSPVQTLQKHAWGSEWGRTRENTVPSPFLGLIHLNNVCIAFCFDVPAVGTSGVLGRVILRGSARDITLELL